MSFEIRFDYLVVHENAKYGRHHPNDVDQRDRVAQGQEWHRDHSNSLGAVGNSIAEWRDQRYDRKRDHVLCKVAKAVDDE